MRETIWVRNTWTQLFTFVSIGLKLRNQQTRQLIQEEKVRAKQLIYSF